MKSALITGSIAMMATLLFAETEVPKTIKVVGLEDDKDNATVVAPAELGAKPPTVSISADALTTAAAADSRAKAEAKVNTANVKALMIEGMVIPPSSELVKSLEEAVRNILTQAGKQVGTVSSNGIEKLVMPYQQLGDGKSYEVEWRKALRLLLSPVGYNFTEDGELVLFGLAEEVDVKHKQLAQERLTANRTPILFTTNESEGGMELRNAIRDVAVKADVTITTDYMEPADLYVPTQSAATEGTLSAAEIGKAKEKATVQQAQVKRTRFDTNGQQIEWRTVLREILNPHDYDFVEIGGVVRVAKRARIAEWEKEKEMAKPLSARVVKVYHADAESIVERVMKLKILKHPNGMIQAVAKKEDNANIFRGSQSGVTVASGTRMGASSIGNSSAFSSLRRPKIPPAIVIYDLEENLDAVEEKIHLFDIRERQVLIEAIIFDVNDDNGPDGDTTGIDWGKALNDLSIANGAYSHTMSYVDGSQTLKVIDSVSEKLVNQNSLLDNAFNSDFTDSSDNVDDKGAKKPGTTKWDSKSTRNDKFGSNYDYARTDRHEKHYTKDYRNANEFNVTFGPLNFQMVIDLILERDDSRLLSSPMVVIGDHSESVIQVGDATPIPMTKSTIVASGGAGAYETQDTEWQILMTGIMLWVSPEITSDGKSVRLSVHPQITTPGDFVEDRFGARYPKVSSQELDTRVTINSGDSLLLGGLIRSEETEKESRIWLLADIPWIGRFFRWNTKTMVRRNLMMLIRPTILDEDLPESGFEEPTMKYADKLSANMGKNLKLYKAELDDRMTVGENKIEEAIGLKKKEEEKTDTEVKPVEPNQEAKQ